MSTTTPAADVATRPAAVPGRTPVRLGRCSTVWRPRILLAAAVTAILVVGVSALDLGLGEIWVPPTDVLAALLGDQSGAGYVVLGLRLPRAVTGLLAGAALGMSGAITQTVARNALASPDLLGVTGGAGVAAVSLIVVGGGFFGSASAALPVLAVVGLPLAALAGALVTAAVIGALAWRGGLQSYRLVLVGVAASALATSVTSWLLLAADVSDAGQAMVWLTGSLNGRGWEHAVPVGLALLVLVVPAGLLNHRLEVLQLGDDLARGLGLSITWTRTALLLVAVGLAAMATAAAGPIAFVALVVPQVGQRLVRAARPSLLLSALLGALLVMVGDLVARSVLDELPAGIVTAALGAPYLLHLLVRRHRGAAA